MILGRCSIDLMKWSRNAVCLSLLSGLHQWASWLLIISFSSSPLPPDPSAFVFLVISLIFGFLPMHTCACLYCCSPLSLPFSKGLRSPGGLRNRGRSRRCFCPFLGLISVTLQQCWPRHAASIQPEER